MNYDLISREALKEEFLSKTHLTLFELLDLIDNAPRVPLPDFKEGYKQAIIDGKTNFSKPQGEWIKDSQGKTICSNCGFECLYSEDGFLYSLGRYCHHCGAKMQKGGAEND